MWNYCTNCFLASQTVVWSRTDHSGGIAVLATLVAVVQLGLLERAIEATNIISLSCWIPRLNCLCYSLTNIHQGRKCWTTQAYLSELFPAPINVDPHYISTDATVEHNLETRRGKGNSILRQEFGITILFHNGQKNHFSAVNGWMELNKERRSNDFWPWL